MHMQCVKHGGIGSANTCTWTSIAEGFPLVLNKTLALTADKENSITLDSAKSMIIMNTNNNYLATIIIKF